MKTDSRLEDNLDRIRDLISCITGGESGIIIYLKGVLFNETCRSSIGSSAIAVSCIFIDEEDRICADMYRSGAAGFYEFICGRIINGICSSGLEEILYALENGKWSVSEQIKPGKKIRNWNALIPLKMPFHLKGA